MSAPTAPADPIALAAVVRAAQQLNRELQRVPGLLAIVGAKRAALRVQLDAGDLDTRMEMVNTLAELIGAEPRLVEDDGGAHWSADGRVDGADVRTLTLLQIREEVEG